MSIVIEKAMPPDAKALLDYLKQVGGETENLTFGAEGLPVDQEAEARYLAQMKSSKDDVMLLAKENGKIIGTASLNRLPRRMSHRGDFSISVLKEYWNQGIGSRLLEQILVFAREHHFTILDLQVRSVCMKNMAFKKSEHIPLFSWWDKKKFPLITWFSESKTSCLKHLIAKSRKHRFLLFFCVFQRYKPPSSAGESKKDLA